MWARVITIALGVWLLIAPAVIPTDAATRSMDRAVAPVVIWIGVLALRAVTRPARVVTILAGVALLIAPWLTPITTAQQWNSELAGWLLIALSIPQGAIRQEVSGGWMAVLHPRTER